MKGEHKLLNLDLQKEQEKQSLNQPKGIKLYFFRALYSILQYRGLNKFCDILFTIFQFIQLMAFPMDTVFSSGWKTYWYGSIGSFFRYFQLVSLWKGNTKIYLIVYILTILSILFLLILFINLIAKSTSFTNKYPFSAKIISLILDFEVILNIPFLRTLFGAFTCENNNLTIASNIQCKSGIHISLIFLSIIFSLIFIILIIIFNSTLFEFGHHNDKFKAAYCSSTEISLKMSIFILIILYQFLKNEITLSIITFIISLIIFIDFINKQPFSNGFTLKLYFGLYFLFFYSSTICIISILLKNTQFEGGVILLILGYPLIIFSISIIEWDFSFDRIFQFLESKEKDGYKALLEIEYFLKMEVNLEDKIRTKEQKILYSYITNYEKDCPINNCPLKQFMNIPLKIENFVEMKIYLLQHGEVLFKNAVAKFPFNAKLRLSYGLFLYKRVNKKSKGTTEITLLNKYNTNLEDNFLIYRAQRYIQEENDVFSNTINNSNKLNSEKNANEVNSITYKFTINNIKSLIGKITLYYIDFWTNLEMNNESESENFQKMSKIGIKISKLNQELIGNIKKLETVNLYDQEIFKLYIQYLTEILSDNTQANIYINKLIENDQKRHQYNEENFFELNFKAMTKSEDYKYIVVNCSHSNFDIICNLSLSVCSIFGYSREELIGHPYYYLLPEIFYVYHKNLLQNKVDEFKKKLLIKNVKFHSESWIDDSFGKNKMKYLLPIKTRWTLVSSEDEIIYAIGKIFIEDKIPTELEQEVIYILTDKNLIIQNFTSNAPKLLYLHSSAINNNLDITEFIKEFNEDYISNVDKYDDIKGSSISNKSIHINKKQKLKYEKIEIIKKIFLKVKNTTKIINWRLGDIITNDKGNKKNTGKRTSRFQSALTDITKNNFKQKIKTSQKRKISLVVPTGDNDFLNYKKLNASNTEEKLPNYDQEKILDLKDINISDFADDNPFNTNDKIFKDKVYYHRPVHQKFSLSAKEIKFNEFKVGYLFRFEPYFSKILKETNISYKSKNNQLLLKKEINKEENNDIDKSEISIASFTANKQNLDQKHPIIHISPENPFGLHCENNDEFFLKINNEKENEFTVDMNRMSYKQIGINDKSEEKNLYDILRQEAIDKISKVTNQVKNEEISEEEEEESSSDSSDSSGEESSKNTSELSSGRKVEERSSIELNSKNKISQKNENMNSEKKVSVKSDENFPNMNIIVSSKGNNINLNQINPININNIVNKKKEDDYYHVDVSHITYYIYNYTTGFVEILKDPKYKISKIARQINEEKEKVNKINSKYISNPKLAKEKKRGNINKKIANDSNEINSYNEQIQLREIQKVLSSKEKQSTIINLCIFSFLIFALIIGSSVMSIMINFYLEDKSFLYYSLIKNSIELYKNILLEISFVRELIIMNSTYYNNTFYDKNISHYFSNYSDICYEYYLDTSFIISNLTTNINSLDERHKTLFSNKTIYCYIIDPIETGGYKYFPKRYELPLFSAYRELNAALYHISHLKMEQIYTYEDNIYYFLKNGMSNIIINAEDQIKIISNEFEYIIKFGNKIIIICFIVLFIVYAGCFFIFYYFYEKVEERKQNYLSIFYEISDQFIISSLSKCEKFSLKLQMQGDNLAVQGDKISLGSSSFDESYIENDFQASSIIKQNKENKINFSILEKKSKNHFLIKIKIIGFIIFFILFLCQYGSYIYYYSRLSLYMVIVYNMNIILLIIFQVFYIHL